jgi:uncharacterized protein (DUF2267 family)
VEHTVDYRRFTTAVAQRAGVPFEAAEDLERAVLRVLARRISGGEARDLAAQLPAPLQASLIPPDEPAHAFDLEEFVRRVMGDAGVPAEQARAAVAAVFATLRDAVTPGEFEDVLAQLPKEYREVLDSTAARRG